MAPCAPPQVPTTDMTILWLAEANQEDICMDELTYVKSLDDAAEVETMAAGYATPNDADAPPFSATRRYWTHLAYAAGGAGWGDYMFHKEARLAANGLLGIDRLRATPASLLERALSHCKFRTRAGRSCCCPAEHPPAPLLPARSAPRRAGGNAAPCSQRVMVELYCGTAKMARTARNMQGFRILCVDWERCTSKQAHSDGPNVPSGRWTVPLQEGGEASAAESPDETEEERKRREKRRKKTIQPHEFLSMDVNDIGTCDLSMISALISARSRRNPRRSALHRPLLSRTRRVAAHRLRLQNVHQSRDGHARARQEQLLHGHIARGTRYALQWTALGVA